MSAREQVKDPLVTQEAADWHARMRREALSELDEARFRAWLAGNPARRQEFDAISAMWNQLGALADSPEVLAELRSAELGGAERHSAKLGDAERHGVELRGAEPVAAARRLVALPPSGQAAPPRVSRRTVMGWALAASVVASAGVVSWQWLSAPEIYTTGVGEQKIVPLGDGSVITINTSSRISVRFTRSHRRVEVLSGQANFSVAKDTARPFVVSAGGGQTLAVGTEFDVYQRAGDTVVTLIEGRVTVTSPLAGTPAIGLTAGEQVSYSAHGAPEKKTADLRRTSAWRSRKLDFADTPLREAISEANRYSNLKIELRGAELADARISGVFEAGRNDSLAEGVRAYFGLRLERHGDDLIVLSPAAR
jgi:transmembrane sensor